MVDIIIGYADPAEQLIHILPPIYDKLKSTIMIFKDKLESISEIVMPEFRKLINTAWVNQTNYSDLLLIHINGFYNKEIEEWNKARSDKLNPHVIGPGDEGHSEITHYEFINKYRQSYISPIPYSDYTTEFEWAPEKQKEIDVLLDIEETTIQLEMLVYLKFWEADLIIKKLYQLARLLNKEHYDWYFKISESSRDKNSTGSRQEIIRERIRDKIKPHSEPIYQLFKNSYISQLRNAIAHSNYSFQGRNIHLYNYVESDPSCQLRYITFDNWVEIIHSTIIIHNAYISMNNFINSIFGKIAMENENTLTIRITERDNTQYKLPVEYRSRWKDWNYKQKE